MERVRSEWLSQNGWEWIYRYRFIDSEAGGTSAQRDIADVGEDGFLAIENQVNCQVNAEHAVISPGGSVVYCEEAMKHFKEIGTVVYLKGFLSHNKREDPQSEKAGSRTQRRADFPGFV